MKNIINSFALIPLIVVVCFASVGLYHSEVLEIGGDGAAPTASSCGSPPPDPVGNDNVAKVTPGTGAITSCTVNFGSGFTNEPHCVISCKDSVDCELETSNTGYITVDFVTKPAYIQYICLGHR
jgi:hypothetical protein